MQGRPATYIEMAELKSAREQLSESVLSIASLLVGCLNLRIVLHTEDTPPCLDSMTQLLAEENKLRIRLGASDNTIYTSKDADHAFRIWHVLKHWQINAGFDEVGERRVFAQLGFDLYPVIFTQVPYVLLEADTYGQLDYHAEHGKFQGNRLKFAVQYMRDKHHIIVKDWNYDETD